MQIIKELSQEHPDLSDLKLSHILKQQGINIARRTVAKYRQMAGEKNSFEREVDNTQNEEDPENNTKGDTHAE